MSLPWFFGITLGLLLMVPRAAEANPPTRPPSMLHGLGQAVGGVIYELPKTVVEATVSGPPVVGTMVGLLAGTVRAAQAMVGGVVEMTQAFDPWGTKQR